MKDPLPLLCAKAAIASAAVLLFLLPLATPPGLIAGVAGTLIGYLLARRAAGAGLRVPAGLALAGLALLAAHVASRWLLARAPGGPEVALEISDAVFFGVGALGAFFGVRVLSQRAPIFSLVEAGLVVAAVAHTFADHRHHHIQQPRYFSDWALSQGLDPSTLLAGAGIAVVVLAAVLLLRTRRVTKVLLTLLLLVAGALLAFLLLRAVHIDSDADTNGLALTKNSQGGGGGGGGGGGSSRPPDPVAVAVFHDEVPDANVLYFRQTVLSRFAVDRLVRDTSGRYDRDVISAFPAAAPLRAVSTQAPALHRRLHTSMFLIVDHAEPIGLGQPYELRPLSNPNPRAFVAAYDVDSHYFDDDFKRLVGRPAVPASWSADKRRHYLAMPADPRYRELSDRLVRDIDPRFVGDDMMKALAIKRYLEKNGFYSLKQKTLVGTDPTAKFLFGDMHGYCVHFAHAAAFLLRSQGIPARVALGYGVQTTRRGAGSSIVIFGNEAHAWPEMYLDGVGWITFDIYPEHSDEPPPPPIDADLESLLGELARRDRTGGKAPDPRGGLHIPWTAIRGGLGALLGALLVLGYAVKIVRRLRRGDQRRLYRGVLDRLSDLGLERRVGESRERHAARVAPLAPSFVPLTRAHLRAVLGRAGDAALPQMAALARATRAELRANSSLLSRLWAFLHPFGWWLTR